MTATIEFTAERYIQDVLSGAQVCCKWVRLAVERHVRDLETGAERGLWFDPQAARVVIAFYSLLKHSKGEWAGQSIRLEPWQQFIKWVLFGWKRADGRRRFRTAYIEVARKNGKSTDGAGVGLVGLLADGEPGAEVYTAATKRDQARITHAEATRMAKASPAIRREVRIYKDNIHVPDTASKYEPLGADADSMDGLNVHMAIIDELHAHKTRETWDVLDTATGSRRQPMMYGITTAGFGTEGLCVDLHNYTERVLEGAIEDDSWFGIIYTLDEGEAEGDGWMNEAIWVKANPNLGVSKKLDDMRSKALKAKEMPAALNNFLRKELNVWTQAVTAWVPYDHWQKCGQAVDALGLRGRVCYGGLDLSSNTDISSLALVFEPQDGIYPVLMFFWIPEDNMHLRTKRDNVPYEAWVRQGFLIATPGNVIDYDFILSQVDEIMQLYDLREIAFDRWGATKIAQALQELGGQDFMVQMGQGFASMSPPMKELETLILGHKLAHGNNPVLNWMANNLVAREDPAGNIKPDKEKSKAKIDGMVSLIMGLDRATRHGGESVYDERGLREL